MLAYLTTGWGRVAASLILASLVLAGIVTFDALQRQAGRQAAALESTTQTLRNAEERYGIEDDLHQHRIGASEQILVMSPDPKMLTLTKCIDTNRKMRILLSKMQLIFAF